MVGVGAVGGPFGFGAGVGVDVDFFVEGVDEEGSFGAGEVEGDVAPGGEGFGAVPGGDVGDFEAALHFEVEAADVVGLDVVVEESAFFAVDFGEFFSGEPAHEVGDVDGVIHDGTAAGEGGVDEPAAGELSVVGAGHGDEVADFALVEALLEVLEGGDVAAGEGGAESDLGFFAGGDHGEGVFEGGGEGFLAEDPFSGLGGGFGVGAVVDVFGADDDALDVAGEEVVEFGVEGGVVVLGGGFSALGVGVPECGELDVGEVVEGLGVAVGVHVGEADDADVDHGGGVLFVLVIAFWGA